MKKLLITDSAGQYIPQIWYEKCYLDVHWSSNNGWGWIGVPKWTRSIIEAGPEHEEYWDAWESILNSTKYIAASGLIWTLHLDGDLWAVSEDHVWEDEEI